MGKPEDKTTPSVGRFIWSGDKDAGGWADADTGRPITSYAADAIDRGEGGSVGYPTAVREKNPYALVDQRQDYVNRPVADTNGTASDDSAKTNNSGHGAMTHKSPVQPHPDENLEDWADKLLVSQREKHDTWMRGNAASQLKAAADRQAPTPAELDARHMSAAQQTAHANWMSGTDAERNRIHPDGLDAISQREQPREYHAGPPAPGIAHSPYQEPAPHAGDPMAMAQMWAKIAAAKQNATPEDIAEFQQMQARLMPKRGM